MKKIIKQIKHRVHDMTPFEQLEYLTYLTIVFWGIAAGRGL